MSETPSAPNPIASPGMISRFKKERFLLSMSEDDFRDKVVRPLFLRQGLRACTSLFPKKCLYFVNTIEH